MTDATPFARLTALVQRYEDGSFGTLAADFAREVKRFLPDLAAQIAAGTQAQQERDDAMLVLAPNMPSSGLVDACKQVKQVAISEADNSDKLDHKSLN